jgi:hypothetical protein
VVSPGEASLPAGQNDGYQMGDLLDVAKAARNLPAGVIMQRAGRELEGASVLCERGRGPMQPSPPLIDELFKKPV